MHTPLIIIIFLLIVLVMIVRYVNTQANEFQRICLMELSDDKLAEEIQWAIAFGDSVSAYYDEWARREKLLRMYNK